MTVDELLLKCVLDDNMSGTDWQVLLLLLLTGQDGKAVPLVKIDRSRDARLKAAKRLRDKGFIKRVKQGQWRLSDALREMVAADAKRSGATVAKTSDAPSSLGDFSGGKTTLADFSNDVQSPQTPAVAPVPAKEATPEPPPDNRHAFLKRDFAFSQRPALVAWRDSSAQIDLLQLVVNLLQGSESAARHPRIVEALDLAERWADRLQAAS